MVKNPKIALVGNGLASLFFKAAFSSIGNNPTVYARTPKKGDFELDKLVENISSYDLILLCVSDSAIAQVSATLVAAPGIVAHVSGAMPLSSLDYSIARPAVFYPLMSMKDTGIKELPQVPFCLEAKNNSDLAFLSRVVHSFGAKYFEVDSDKRVSLHLAAVLANNFTNQLYNLASEVLHDINLEFNIMLPMLSNALHKLENHSPLEIQTGPALRKDEVTIQKHLALINDPLTKDIYKLLTQSIQQAHDKKL